MKSRRVLVIDDEEDIRTLISELLRRASYDVLEATDGRVGLRLLHESVPDLVLLDVSMPQLDGWQTLERIRDLSDVPVIMLTARDGELEKVRGLKAGADDYVTKPFGRQELLARVEALLRRGAEPVVVDDYDDGVVSIDVAQRRVLVRGEDVQLTPLEFRLISYLLHNKGRVVSREELKDHIYGSEDGRDDNAIEAMVTRLRRKLGFEHIETRRGHGYCLKVTA